MFILINVQYNFRVHLQSLNKLGVIWTNMCLQGKKEINLAM